MKKELSPAVVIGVLVCVLGIAGFFVHRAYFGSRSYWNAQRLSDKSQKLVQTPYGWMTKKQAARLGGIGASNTQQTVGR